VIRAKALETVASIQSHTWLQFVAALEHGKPTCWSRDMQASQKLDGYATAPEWCLGMSYVDTLKLIKGQPIWREGKIMIEQIAREQAGKRVRMRPMIDTGLDVTGMGFDIGLALSGQPEHWLMPVHSNVGEPGVVPLVVATGTSNVVSASLMIDRMTAIAAAALTLQASGTPVEIYVLHHTPQTHAQSTGYLHEVKVCSAGEPLDLTRLTAMAHPAFHRRAMFRLAELTSDRNVASCWQDSYGSPQAWSDSHLTKLYGRRAVYIPPCDGTTHVMPTCEALLALVKQRISTRGHDDYV
jgi:hypothetical protein